jgi:hypothetical protein
MESAYPLKNARQQHGAAGDGPNDRKGVDRQLPSIKSTRKKQETKRELLAGRVEFVVVEYTLVDLHSQKMHRAPKRNTRSPSNPFLRILHFHLDSVS